MTLWFLAALAGLLAALLLYGRTALTPRAAPLALLRAMAAALVVALVLGAPAGRARLPTPDVALDGSLSWLRAAPRCDRWTAALDTVNRLARGTRLRFGDSVRVDARGEAGSPTDRASRLRAVADRASGTGRPVIIVTDGELDDAELMPTLPRGSRVIVMPCAPAPDVAVSELDAPRTLLAGDTVTTRITLLAGGAGAPAGRLELRLDGALLAGEDLAAMTPFAEQTVALRGLATGGDRGTVLSAIVRAAGDAEPRNDTLSIGVDVSRAAAAVFVSTAPDYDAREAVAALRGVTSLPTRVYYRVAPGSWRTDGTLGRVEEREVTAAVREAPLVVLHGDTSAFGAPRTVTHGALLLFAPPAADQGEWFASSTPASPLAPALGGLLYDSLPPMSVAPPSAMPRGDWEGLVTHRSGAPDDRRVALVGWDAPRHIALLGASGLWRWRFRGGVRADAYGALFGSLFDWLAAGRSDRRAAVPDADPIRAGAPIRWRRGAPGDSVVRVTVTRRSATGRVYSLTLRFGDGAIVTESPSLPPGIYDARMNGGSVVLAVNPSRELLPRRPTVRIGMVGGTATAGGAPALRELGWVYLLVVLLLCGEWILRRRVGMR